MPRYFVNTRSAPSGKVGSIRAATETDTASDSSQSLDITKRLKRENTIDSRSNHSHRSSKQFFTGRFLARESGFVPCKAELCLKLVPNQKRRFPWQRDRIDVAVLEPSKAAPDGKFVLSHYAGGTRVHVAGGGSCYTVRNCRGVPAGKCWLVDRTKVAVICGSRPLFPGTKALCREGATNFYPWLRVRLLKNGTVSLELYHTNQPMWYSEQTVASDRITITSVADDSVATIVCVGEALVTIAPGVDPAVMMCLALLLKSMAKAKRA